MDTKSISDPNLFEEYPKEIPINNGFLYQFPERSYRVLGMSTQGLDRLKVNLKAMQGAAFHIDTLDLYSNRMRENFVQKAADILNTDEAALTQELNQLIDKLEVKRLEIQKDEPDNAPKEMTEADRAEALKFLRSPDLIEKINHDFDACGYIGEETPRLFGYLATISRFLEKPLGLLIVSRSGAGKSQLMDIIAKFVPAEHLKKYTRVSGQALFYQDNGNLKYSVLAIAEEKGAEDAIYSIRTLQSDQYLTVAVTITDPKTGTKRTEEYRVEGPVVIMITTTNPEALDFETRNRFVILTIDESREQTKRILKKQREQESLEGLVQSRTEDVIFKKHHNAQRLLKRIDVVNPYHNDLTYPDDKLLMRREQKKYLTLISTIAYLHQYQREIKKVKTSTGEIEYIEASVDDIALANKLASDILGRSLDELSPHTRSLLQEIKRMVDERCTKEKKKRDLIFFTRRELCAFCGWSYWQVHAHLETLMKMEYIAGEKSGKSNLFQYELLWDGEGEAGEKFFIGLIDTEKLKKKKSR
ncbi:hypothetical protein JNL27_11925 [bacterium]|nr:hypothetical protein [bacterium]